jgi:hypothetical protein
MRWMIPSLWLGIYFENDNNIFSELLPIDGAVMTFPKLQIRLYWNFNYLNNSTSEITVRDF